MRLLPSATMDTINLLHQYQNGNYQVSLYADGTKVRETEAEVFLPQFPENVDLKITDYCEVNCPMCHERSTTQGRHGDLTHPTLKTFHPGTELAIGGGNPLAHPELIDFLHQCKEIGVIANMTVNQVHFLQQENLLHELCEKKLIYGLGVSLTHPGENFIAHVKTFKNAVVHTINGYHPVSSFEKLAGHGLKVLILGYKHFGRGIAYHSPRVETLKQELYTALPDLLSGFKVVSFDNLALEQLEVKRLLSPKAWETFYMGDDGGFTFYMDAVKQEYALNSFAEKREAFLGSVEEMFTKLQNEKPLSPL